MLEWIFALLGNRHAHCAVTVGANGGKIPLLSVCACESLLVCKTTARGRQGHAKGMPAPGIFSYPSSAPRHARLYASGKHTIVDISTTCG